MFVFHDFSVIGSPDLTKTSLCRETQFEAIAKATHGISARPPWRAFRILAISSVSVCGSAIFENPNVATSNPTSEKRFFECI